MKSVYKFFLETIRSAEQLEFIAKPGAALTTLIILVLIAWISHFVAKKIIVKTATRISRRTKTKWDDFLLHRKFFSYLSHIVPALILYNAAGFSFPEIHQNINELSDAALEVLSKDYYIGLAGFFIKVAKVYFVLIFVLVLNSLLNAGLDVYNTTPFARNRPLKVYIQLFKILFFSLSGILIISILLERDPTVLLAGLGAFGAILLLVFKDSILGFVASIQLSGNNMLKIGDWVEMPSRRADGSVIDITLNTVKVQNWDKTISTIPTYAMISESFINWKGMQEAGGRRIKRSINIDMNSIRFCDKEMLSRFGKFELIRDYVREKEKEINEYNEQKNISSEDIISGRKQTNIGVFRKYLEAYLRRHPMVNKELTFIVRHLQPTEKGLPIEIYIFSSDTAWVNYEAIQADIFDHILAVVPEFELRIFQEPSGADISAAISKSNRPFQGVFPEQKQE
jgi:miniconductance mechanosensitive channel